MLDFLKHKADHYLSMLIQPLSTESLASFTNDQYFFYADIK